MSPFRESLPMTMYITLDGVMPVYRDLFSRHGLTEQNWRVLRVLWDEKSVTTIQLSRQTLLPAPSLVGILDRLEKRQLVQRERSSVDRRKVNVSATETGLALYERVFPALERIHARVSSAVTPEEWNAMRSTLDKITQSMSGLTLDGLLAEAETA